MEEKRKEIGTSNPVEMHLLLHRQCSRCHAMYCEGWWQSLSLLAENLFENSWPKLAFTDVFTILSLKSDSFHWVYIPLLN